MSAPADRANDASVCRKSCTRIVGRPSSAILILQPTARFQFSSPSREPFTRGYIARRLAESKTKNEIMRCLKRSIAREIFHALHPPSRPAAEFVA
jgi:hypothetical protein